MNKDVVLDNLLLTEPMRAKAKLKYELRNLESKLAQLIKAKNQMPALEIANLCQLLIDKYLDYLYLMGGVIPSTFFLALEQEKKTSWFEHYQLLLRLKKQLSTAPLEEEKNLLIDIATLYFYIKQIHLESAPSLELGPPKSDVLYELFLSGDLKIWLIGLINYWNQHKPESILTSIDFLKWTKQQQLYALDFFASTECVHLINALFFYQIVPEQLEKSLHPEKLISLQFKVGHLHSYLTLLRQQIYKAVALNGINPGVDFLCHNKELPPGVKFEIHSTYQHLILEAVKLFKVGTKISANELNKTHLIQDVFAAYKFRFNPSRLVDTAMVLRQVIGSGDEAVFYQEMINLYQQLTTTECLDLYGYFSNKDTRYLMCSLCFILNHSASCNWLPSLTAKTNRLIQHCFTILQLIMEALRAELKNRMIHTDFYHYELPTKEVEIRKRNQQAILRLIAIYSADSIQSNTSLEQLFLEMEKDE